MGPPPAPDDRAVVPDLYPLVDYYSVRQPGPGADGPPLRGRHPVPGVGADTDPAAMLAAPHDDYHDQDLVVIDDSAGEIQDHYLNTEDLVAAGLLGPEHAPPEPVIVPPGGPGHRHRGRSTVLAVLGIVVLLIVVGVFYVDHQANPGGKQGPKVAVVIPAHSSTSKIASILAGKGIIHDAGLFALYAKVQGSGSLQSGTYQLAKNEKYGNVVDALEAGPPQVVDRLTVPEGYTLRDIAARLASLPGLHLSAQRFMAASSSGTVRSPYEPAGVNDLEGLVFPATYDINSTETEVDVMQKMVQAFNDEAQQLGLAKGAAALHMSPYDVIKVASIVEGEAKLDGDRGPVASSIYNRLSDGMTLGADSTLIYQLRQSDPNLNINSINYEQSSPYNTRLNRGLPPTPIDNPGIPSLTAAINPPQTSYLYFVETNPDGQLSFATTNAGFQQLTNECQAAHLC